MKSTLTIEKRAEWVRFDPCRPPLRKVGEAKPFPWAARLNYPGVWERRLVSQTGEQFVRSLAERELPRAVASGRRTEPLPTGVGLPGGQDGGPRGEDRPDEPSATISLRGLC